MNQKRLDYQIDLELIKNRLHGRSLAEKVKEPLTTVQRGLKILEKEKIIDFEEIGKNKIYFLKKNLYVQKSVHNAENFKFIKLLNKYPFLEPIIEDILKKCPRSLVIIFGSYAKFLATEKSDLDLYVETANLKVKRELEEIYSKLNVKIGKFSLNSLLVKEIIRNHVIIKGVEDYYEKINFFENIEERKETKVS